MALPQETLAACTNGEVFADPREHSLPFAGICWPVIRSRSAAKSWRPTAPWQVKPDSIIICAV